MGKKGRKLEQVALKFIVKEKGIGWLEWEEPEYPVNVLSRRVLKELENLLPEVEKASLKVLVLISRKSKGFIAGADLRELGDVKSKEELSPLLEKAHEIFLRFEALPAIKLAVIHGACLGGGLELALICNYRLASSSPETCFGLPEVNLGLIPGFGGTFRLPQKIGLKAGLDMILSGRNVSAKTALWLGLVEEVVPLVLLKKRAEELAQKVIRGEKLLHSFQKNKGRNWKKALAENFLFRPLVFYWAKRNLLKKTKGFYPAPLCAWQVIKNTYGTSSLEKALVQEREGFLDVTFTSESRNLIRVFFLRDRAKKRTLCSVDSDNFSGKEGPFQKQSKSSQRTDEIKKPSLSDIRSNNEMRKKSPPYQVGILGAGVMGGGLSRLLVEKGHSVRLRDIKKEALSHTLIQMEEIWGKQFLQGKIDKQEWQKRRDRISVTRDFSGFSSVDLVIETLPEDQKLKEKVLQEAGACLTPFQVLASNTSSLNLKDLASAYPWPKQFVGMHFFNPVHKMPLVEIIKTDQSEEAVVNRVFQLTKQLGKIPIVVQDSPGFIVNRLLMPYLSEALWLLQEGHSIQEVDHCYTHGFGFPMGPFRLMDEVGLDLCLKVIESFERAGLRVNIPEGMKNILQDLGPGRRGGEGFYIYGRKPQVNEKIRSFQKPGVQTDSKECVQRGLYRLINEAVQIQEEKVAQEEDIDLALVLGMGFPPFLGGPLKYARDKGFSVIQKGLRDFAHRLGPRFIPHSALK